MLPLAKRNSFEAADMSPLEGVAVVHPPWGCWLVGWPARLPSLGWCEGVGGGEGGRTVAVLGWLRVLAAGESDGGMEGLDEIGLSLVGRARDAWGGRGGWGSGGEERAQGEG